MQREREDATRERMNVVRENGHGAPNPNLGDQNSPQKHFLLLLDAARAREGVSNLDWSLPVRMDSPGSPPTWGWLPFAPGSSEGSGRLSQS